MTTLPYRRTFRDALHAIERERFATTESPAISSKSVDTDIHPPEPCNFCAPDELVEPKDRFAELAQVLGRYWLLWLIAFTGLCVVSALLAVVLVAELVAP